jgi:hypothetical protein
MEKATFRVLCLSLLLASTTAFSQGLTNFVGQVLYHNNYPISGVNAYLHVPGGNIIATAVTNSEGYYEFTNVTPGDYTITFSTQQPAGGVELNDAFLVMLKVLNMYIFTPIQTIAADVNGSGTITMQDFTMILVGYLNRGIPFPNPWVFESISTPIPPPSRDGVISRGGSSSGDVNGSLQPDDKNNSIFITNPVVNMTAASSDPVDFSIASGQNLKIAGMHLVIDIPEELKVIDVESMISQANVSLSGNQIKVTWLDETRQGYELTDGEPLFKVKAQPSRPSRNGDTYCLELGRESHFINTEGKLLNGVSLNLPIINLSVENKLNHSAYPNPFIDNANLEYQIPQDGHVIIALYDQSGKTVKELENGTLSAGSHKVRIEGYDLLPGIYHYTIRYSGDNQYINSGTIIKSK